MASGRSRFRELTRHIDNDTLGDVEINTREELQALADAEGVSINWEKWDELSRKTKEDIEVLLEETTIPLKYVYSLGGKLLGVFKSTKECSDKIGISPEQINFYVRTQKPYLKGGLLFRDSPMEKDTYRSKPKWVYTLEYKLVGVYKNAAEAAEHFHINPSAVSRYAREDRPYLKSKLWFRNEPIKEQKE